MYAWHHGKPACKAREVTRFFAISLTRPVFSCCLKLCMYHTRVTELQIFPFMGSAWPQGAQIKELWAYSLKYKGWWCRLLFAALDACCSVDSLFCGCDQEYICTQECATLCSHLVSVADVEIPHHMIFGHVVRAEHLGWSHARLCVLSVVHVQMCLCAHFTQFLLSHVRKVILRRT